MTSKIINIDIPKTIVYLLFIHFYGILVCINLIMNHVRVTSHYSLVITN